jgi:hypothetical protein
MVFNKLTVIDKLKGAAIFIAHDTKIMPNRKGKEKKGNLHIALCEYN